MRLKISLVLIGLLLANCNLIAQDHEYVGDTVCRDCHVVKYVDYKNSGHPWKLFRSAGQVPDDLTWPNTPVPPLPTAFGEQLEWQDVDYVIGNFYWKARFIDHEGYIWTGDAEDRTQWNLATNEFSPYHPGEDRRYDCGKCHTTGYNPAERYRVQRGTGLPGLAGTWAQDGVTCEACHGPSSEHVMHPNIAPPGGKDCAECHFRDDDFRMPWKDGFMRHHQQAEDLSHSPHAELSCVTCHNPHRSVVYKDGGTIKDCTDCHQGNASNGNYLVAGMEFLDCIDCHMPYMGKSATAINEFEGDIRGHLFDVMTVPIAAEDNVTDGFWNQESDGSAAVTLDYACLGCHVKYWPLVDLETTLVKLSRFAKNIHTRHPGKAPFAGQSAPSPNDVSKRELDLFVKRIVEHVPGQSD